MSSTYATPGPTTSLNVRSFGGKDYAESEAPTSRGAAIREGEEWAERYWYTLTEFGNIDLRSEFFEACQERANFDAAVDARMDDQRRKP